MSVESNAIVGEIADLKRQLVNMTGQRNHWMDNAKLYSAKCTQAEAERDRLRITCEAVLHALNNTDLGGTVLWIRPPYQANAVHETATDRLKSVLTIQVRHPNND